ncbi:hypothetical protein ACJMK2_011213 [Sinanodonta woodiana]|uniref:Transcriptional adapter n=1 Tax=Sinanodonta woodiana TaxID=1069815 RepID=A0ABD3V474_SINWO
MEDVEDRHRCGFCHAHLMEPYIKCCQCTQTEDKMFICLHCFAKGVEFNGHESSHAYSIVKNNFPLFEKGWTALEELNLIKAISDCGYGNWVDVSHQLRTKSAQECERHYTCNYIENPALPLPELPDVQLDIHPLPFVFKLSENPPRPAEGSSVYNEMAGYMAARGDFTSEYDNFMEIDLRQMKFASKDDDELEEDLKLAVLDIYQNCLKERERRKRVIRRYGLINLKALNYFNRRYDRTIKHLLDGLRVFMRLLSPEEYEKFIESLHYEYEIKNEIQKLQLFRDNGLTLLRQIKLFTILRAQHEQQREQRHLLNDVLMHLKDEVACQSWLQRQAALDTMGKGLLVNLPTAPRRVAAPLEIIGLPGYDKLTSKERELCATVRLVPEAYLEFKSLLLNECQKYGCLKLAQARQLIKIDVNKTRKIYDFLCTEGVLNKDPL